jgi:hypothetical protein
MPASAHENLRLGGLVGMCINDRAPRNLAREKRRGITAKSPPADPNARRQPQL